MAKDEAGDDKLAALDQGRKRVADAFMKAGTVKGVGLGSGRVRVYIDEGVCCQTKAAIEHEAGVPVQFVMTGPAEADEAAESNDHRCG